MTDEAKQVKETKDEQNEALHMTRNPGGHMRYHSVAGCMNKERALGLMP